MSYILDALRKADAQRARGAVPNLAAQPLAEAFTAPEVEPARPPRQRVLFIGAAVVGLLVLGALLAWWLMARPATPVVAEVPAAPPPVLQPAPAPPPPPVLATPTGPAPTAEVSLMPLPRPAPPVSPPAASTPSAADAPAVAAPVRLPRLADLPPALRQQVPTLTIGGAMHSEQASGRMLIINGQLYHEGGQPAPGVVLERIQLKSAVLSVRGTRFEIVY